VSRGGRMKGETGGGNHVCPPEQAECVIEEYDKKFINADLWNHVHQLFHSK
jgi:hypothetical protein